MTASCQVDFYVLARASQSAEQLVCRLAMMAWEQGHQIAVCTADDTAARRLDELMWDQPPGRFLPHGMAAESEHTPVSIVAGNQSIPEGRSLVINLCASAVPEPERFGRLCEIVPADAAHREASRKKFRTYRNGGLEPAHHTIG